MSDYLIFGRRAYQQPLEQLGTTRLEEEWPEDKTRLVEQARRQYGADGWIEMIAIPRSAAIRVIPVSSA
jgi:hypothetical protein